MIVKKQYEVKENDLTLGKVVINYEEKDKWGKLKIESIYGNFHYAWYSLGSEFRLFLGKADIGYYLSTKLLDDKKHMLFDSKETIECIKSKIIEERKKQYIDESEARLAWKTIPKDTEDWSSFYGYIMATDLFEGDTSYLINSYIKPIKDFREIFLPKMQEMMLLDYNTSKKL